MEAAASQKYEDFEPSTEIVQEKDCDTILLHVPGFKREKLRVQLTSTKILRISGEKEIENNKSIRFQKEFPVSSNYDTKKITAKFERGILYIRQTKLITPEDNQDTKLPVIEPPTPQKPEDKPQPGKHVDEPRRPLKTGDEAQPQKNVQQQTAEKTSPRDGSNKQTNAQDVSQKKLEKEELKAKDEKGIESRDSRSMEKSSEEKKPGSLDDGKIQASFTSEKCENDATKAADRKDKGTTNGTDVDLAAKLKNSRRIMNVVLVVLLAVVVGLYTANFIKSIRTAEN